MTDNDSKDQPSALASQPDDFYKAFNTRIANALISSSRLPKLGAGYELYNLNQKYAAISKNLRNRLFNVMRAALQNAGYSLSPSTCLDDLTELIPATDFLLERAATELDAHENKERDYPVKIRGPDGKMRAPNETYGKELGGRYSNLFNRTKEGGAALPDEKRQIPKPQLQFMDSIINDDAPFVPKLRIKHHSLDQTRSSGLSITDEGDTAGRKWLSDLDTNQHPYQNEILNAKLPENQLSHSGSRFPLKSLEETPLHFINDEDGLKALVGTLNNVTEFAVDLEHHSHRSFLGITCLVQISTRDADYIIDPFPIWGKMFLLNEPFTDPKILKVFHGADSDVLWLQRDFGIYVVNMLDTYVFMKLMDQPKRSLQVLVSTHCGIHLPKTHQHSDWRMRPLDEDHIKYARCDTHYLLHCYEKLSQQIKQHNKLDILDVYDACRELCLKQFEQPRFNPTGYTKIVEKSRRILNNRQLHALQSLWKWRDQTARKEDESYQYVLPDHMLYHIAEVLPREVQGVMACCAPVPVLVKRDLFLIHRFIKEARDLPLEQKATTALEAELSETALLEALRTQHQKIHQYNREFSRLDSRFDQSEYKVDDKRPPIEARFKQLFSEEIKMAPASLRKPDPILPFKPLAPLEKKSRKRPNAENILKRFESWATPYDSYLVKLAEKTKEEPPEKRKRAA